jgi:tetratricopeptide (TPR) repeat protein
MRKPSVRSLIVILALILAGAGAAFVFSWWKGGGDALSSEALNHFRLAQNSMENQDFDGAIAEFHQCLEFWPLDGETHFLLARLFRRTDDLDGWQVHLNNAQALGWSKEDLAREKVLMQIQMGTLPGAEPFVLKQLESNSIDKELLLEALIKYCLGQDRVDEAVKWATLWIENKAADGPAYYLRGQANQARRALAKAIADYQRALEIQPNWPEALLKLADVLAQEGSYEEALKKYQGFLEFRPDHAAGLFGVAHCQYFLGQKEEAGASLQRLFAKYPDHRAGVFLQAKLILDEGDNQKALSWLRRAEKLAPNEVDITYTIAGVLRKLDQIEEASRYDRKLADLRSAIARLEALRKQVRMEPDKVDLRFEAATLFAKLDREEEAERWLLIVLRLDPRHAAAHSALAEYYQKKGDARRAAIHRHKAAGNEGSTHS